MDAEKTFAEVGILVKVDKRNRVFRKKRGKIPNNQKKDIIKDINDNNLILSHFLQILFFS